MLFMGDKYRSGIDGYGPVCKGTKQEMIDWDENNGKNFAKLICGTMGFGDAQFLGLRREYDQFMETNNMQNQGQF